MKLVKPNWYQFNHAAVKSMYSGGLNFVNEFCVNGEYQPSAIYRADKPDRSKGHKKYMLITKDSKGYVIRGMSAQKMQQFRYQDALHCLSCDDVIYSVMRHDFRACSCGKVKIDGGRDYTQVSYDPNAPHELVTLDLLTDKISDPRNK